MEFEFSAFPRNCFGGTNGNTFTATYALVVANVVDVHFAMSYAFSAVYTGFLVVSYAD